MDTDNILETRVMYDKIRAYREYTRLDSSYSIGGETSIRKFLDKLQIESLAETGWVMEQSEIRFVTSGTYGNNLIG